MRMEREREVEEEWRRRRRRRKRESETQTGRREKAESPGFPICLSLLSSSSLFSLDSHQLL